MSWRTVVIASRCKLDYKMGFMVVRAEETKKIFLDEIAVLLIENPAVALTGCLLEALVAKKIRVIFCDAKRSPNAELVPYYNAYDCSRKLKAQIAWSDDLKGAVWADIVAEKIRKQADFLNDLKNTKEALMLQSYLAQIEHRDATNREGHAAKVYFNALFGMDFTRSEENAINAALNYGYSIILSAFNREIAAHGYLTQLGIFHDNMFNHFNLSCDLMEPFRILIDRKVKSMKFTDLTGAEKRYIISILHETVTINHTKQTVLNAIKFYCRSVFDALNEGDLSLIQFYSL
ncbi:MAG: type II CRISPR-associated endonuclease Cas1 [Ruminococcaceae bacterium]|nr:type II CRISPR-associated endonuclease Cas1 [Oscillospiraceae bacterium]